MAGRPSMSTVIEVDNLRKAYGDVVAIDGVSFQVRQGEIFGMVGANGAGKTTTIECIEGLRRPDGGSVRLLGLDPAREQRQVADRIGIQLQDERQVDLAGLLDRMGLVNQPEVVFFDELTTGLDPQAHRSMWETGHAGPRLGMHRRAQGPLVRHDLVRDAPGGRGVGRHDGGLRPAHSHVLSLGVGFTRTSLIWYRLEAHCG